MDSFWLHRSELQIWKTPVFFGGGVSPRFGFSQSLQYAIANMADIKTPLCALSANPGTKQPFPHCIAHVRGHKSSTLQLRHAIQRA